MRSPREYISAAKRRALIILHRLSHGHKVSVVANWILEKKGLRAARSLTSIAASASERLTLVEKSYSTISSPRPINGSKHVHVGISPEINAYVIHGAIVSAYSPGIILGDQIALPGPILENMDRGQTDSDGLFHIGDGCHFINKQTCESIDQAILVGGAGAFNWFHFVMEVLPKAYLSEKLQKAFAEFPMITCMEAKKYGNYQDALTLFSPNRRVIYLPRGHHLRVRNLVVFDDISFAHFNMRDGLWPGVDDYVIHDEALTSFIKAMRTRVVQQSNRPGDPKRIFLVRPELRRGYNQAELVNIAAKYGFRAIAPESHSLSEQARLFANAEMVVGASGAAWVRMIFCRQPAKFLSWLIPEYQYFSSYSSMANILGHDMRFIGANTTHPIRNTSEAYRASYLVSPSEFEHAIKQMAENL